MEGANGCGKVRPCEWVKCDESEVTDTSVGNVTGKIERQSIAENFFKRKRGDESVQGEARTASTQKQCLKPSKSCDQSCPPVVDGYGGTKVFCGEVEEDVKDIDPDSGTGTSTPVAAGKAANRCRWERADLQQKVVVGKFPDWWKDAVGQLHGEVHPDKMPRYRPGLQ